MKQTSSSPKRSPWIGGRRYSCGAKIVLSESAKARRMKVSESFDNTLNAEDDSVEVLLTQKQSQEATSSIASKPKCLSKLKGRSKSDDDSNRRNSSGKATTTTPPKTQRRFSLRNSLSTIEKSNSTASLSCQTKQETTKSKQQPKNNNPPPPPPPPPKSDDNTSTPPAKTATASAAKPPKKKSSNSRGRALVKMFEPVTASHWSPSGSVFSSSSSKKGNKNKEDDLIVSDLRPLLLLMDIGSCASAEKHTKVNCVTASMGDVVIENYPRVGDLLELRASPVSVGRTSLDVAVLVVAHGPSSGDNDDDDDDVDDDVDDDFFDDDDDEHNFASSATQTRRVCEAFFTYVTTRGPNGEKRFCPKLEDDDEEKDIDTNIIVPSTQKKRLKWERTIATFRKELIRSEKAYAKTQSVLQTSRMNVNCYKNLNKGNRTVKQSIVPKDIFEMSEVVLPSNLNHMTNLFGGVVMGWMCKSVIAGCVKACRLPANKFLIRAIHRVDFPKGASVSDHVFFRPKITGIFDDGRSAEFEVTVGKRNVTPIQYNRDNAVYDNEEETIMNIGHFYVSGSSSYKSHYFKANNEKKKKLPSGVAPFANILRTHAHLYSENSIYNRTERDMAYQRRKSLLARRHLFSGLGDSIHWDSTLKVQAPLLTILSVLHLCDDYGDSFAAGVDAKNVDDLLHSIRDGGEDEEISEMKFVSDYEKNRNSWNVIDSILKFKQGSSDHQVEWTKRHTTNTFVFRGKTVISRKKIKNNDSFLEAVFTTLCDNRPEWDPACKQVKILETVHDDDDDEEGGSGDHHEKENSGIVQWDVVEYTMESQTIATKFCLLRAGAYVNDEGVDSSISASINSITERKSAVMASRSVIHDQSDAEIVQNRVLPSGWLLKVIENSNNNNEKVKNDKDHDFLEITYFMEQDFDRLRKSSFGGNPEVTDKHIADFLGMHIIQWFTNLSSFDHTTTQ